MLSRPKYGRVCCAAFEKKNTLSECFIVGRGCRFSCFFSFSERHHPPARGEETFLAREEETYFFAYLSYLINRRS
jgi:hypothetical protein